MSAKTKAGQIWTDSVAYVALLTGAGLSIAGNVANVVRTRGVLVDTLDIVLAVAYPALVVLMVEVFVSARWRGLAWPMQMLRWLGTLSIGAVAMRVSWVHLNELMLSRGQAADVATLGPLAIDFLAIMATALILAGRGVARPVAVPAMSAAAILAERQERLDKIRAATVALSATNPLVPQTDEASVADEAQHYLSRLAGELDNSTTPAAPIEVNSTTPTAPARVRPESVPDTARELIEAWAQAPAKDRPRPGQADEAVAAVHNVSSRTARGWRDALVKTSA